MSKQSIVPGKYVSLTYSIVDQQGSVLEQHDVPVGFVYGSDTEMIGGMDAALKGKKAGDEVLVDIPAENALGAHDPSLVFTDDLENAPPEFRRIGAEVQMQNEAGDVKSFYVTHIENGKITLDGNHPMAGKDLTVRVTIHEVRDAAKGEDQVSGIHAGQMRSSSDSLN